MWHAACMFSCFAVTLGCGTLYAYSAYAPQLSDRLGLSASTISTIGMVGNFAMALSGPFSGMIVDNLGFTIPVLLSLVCTLSGYLVVYYCYNHVLASVPLLATALLLIGIGSTAAFSASVKCTALNFPKIRGTATATTMSGYGLSAFAMSLLTQATQRSSYNGGDNTGHMLLVLTVVPAGLIAVFGPLVIKNEPPKLHRAHDEYSLVTIQSDYLVDRVSERPVSEKEVTGLRMLKHPLFYAYFVTLGLLAGMGQAYIYTCGYIVKALIFAELVGDTPLTHELVAPYQAQQVALLSLANCFGRLISGTLSDTVKRRFRVSRTYTLFFSVTLCILGMVACARITRIQNLWIVTVLVGLFYGSVFGAFPGIVSDAFGVKCLSSNWGMVALAPIPFTSWLAMRISRLYDVFADADGKCVGPVCFASAFRMHVGVSMVVFALIVACIRLEKKRQ